MKLSLALALVLSLSLHAQAPNPLRAGGSRPVEPFRVVGNIFYVGAVGVSSHVVVTPEGLILIDTGMREMLPGLRAGIEKLGHRLEDVKIILSSHAHWDHVENHAAMKALTGAKVMAVGQDAAALAAGIDSSPAAAAGWNPVIVDRVLQDGDMVRLGGVTLQAHLTPGHTKGCTTWTTAVHENGKSYLVVFVGGTNVNPGVKLLGNTRHPQIVEDYALTFRVLKALKADVFLTEHPNRHGMAEKMQRLQASSAQNPFVDPAGYRQFVNEQEAAFLKQIEEERSPVR